LTRRSSRSSGTAALASFRNAGTCETRTRADVFGCRTTGARARVGAGQRKTAWQMKRPQPRCPSAAAGPERVSPGAGRKASSGFVAFVVPFGSTSRVARTGGPLTHGRRASLREEVRVPGVTRLYCGLRLRAEPEPLADLRHEAGHRGNSTPLRLVSPCGSKGRTGSLAALWSSGKSSARAEKIARAGHDHLQPWAAGRRLAAGSSGQVPLTEGAAEARVRTSP